MNMRLVSVVLVIGGLWSCKSEGVRFEVESDAEPLPGGRVLLLELKEEGLKPVDTLEMKESGRYESTYEINEESFYRIIAFQKQFVNLVLDGSEDRVEVVLKGIDKSVEGSEKSSFVNRLDLLLANSKSDVDQLNQEAVLANQQGDVGSLQAIIDEYNVLMANQTVRIKNIIRESGSSLAAVYGLNYLDRDSEFAFFDSTISLVYSKLPNHFWVKELKENLDSERALTIGQPAPDFTLNSPEGVAISLSDFKGKYVLVDFWAAWCRPCRVENPNVIKAYQKYGGDKFEILGVSLDRTKEAWMGAIQEDGLSWKHVSDLKYFESQAARLYNINAIPATYLIDPQGRILAKNLRGASLDAKLVELFGE